jgi:adenosylhomocysteine nucleosidase
LAVVASRKRCSSASWRNPTANTALGRVLRQQHGFSTAYSRSFAPARHSLGEGGFIRGYKPDPIRDHPRDPRGKFRSVVSTAFISMKRIAIIAAMAGELKPLVRGWMREARHGVELWRGRLGDSDLIAACAGVGVNAAKRAFEEIEKDGSVDSVFSIGWAGALREEFAAGQAYRVSGVIDARSGDRFSVAGRSLECWLVTSDRVANQADKRQLAITYGAGLVDMEAAGVARQAAMRGIPFYCVKGVSDGFSDQLPDFNAFLSTNGGFQSTQFAIFALLRPWHWPALMRLGQNSKNAAQGIKETLLDILERS